MKHPILETRKYLLLYFAVWLFMSVIQGFVFHTNSLVSLANSFADSFIFHFTFAIYALSVWYALVYDAGNKKGIFYIAFNQITIGVIVLTIWFLTYLFLSELLPQHLYKNTFRLANYRLHLTFGLLYYILNLFFYLTFRFYKNWQEKILLEMQLREKNKEAELAVIKSQINPHFLFNSLNSLSYLILTNADKAHEMLIKLSDFLRYSISQPANQLASLQLEIENSKRYLSIETIRFGERLHFQFYVPDECMEMLLPTLLLQPLYENAIKHNLHESTETIEIKTLARKNGEALSISIQNNKPIYRTPAGKSTGIGLQSIQERLFLVYGEKARMFISNQANEYVVHLEIPQISFKKI